MKLGRAYYQSAINTFLEESEEAILGRLQANGKDFDISSLQTIAWQEEIVFLKRVEYKTILEKNHSEIALEYMIPRMGKRVDVILLHRGYVLVIEFKVGEKSYPKYGVDQVWNYALDLKNFHKESHDACIIPILIATEAENKNIEKITFTDGVANPLCCNKHTFLQLLQILEQEPERFLDYHSWWNSIYKPTPTIIEAAQALYAGHKVEEISHKESEDNDIDKTTSCIDHIIACSKRNKWKSICFVTGVPGAGKTLVGLNIANNRHCYKTGDEEHAVFLSGNAPLVTVLQEALVLDQMQQYETGESKKKTKKEWQREVGSFIQMVHFFRDESVKSTDAPIDKIAIFDEAQRAWDERKLTQFMKQKKGIPNFNKSEPACLIEYMDRHTDWAVIICLVGGGQEIHDGEAGIREWIKAIKEQYSHWKVYYSSKMKGPEYMGNDWDKEIEGLTYEEKIPLHLPVSMRSFRSELVASFVNYLVEGKKEEAAFMYNKIKDTYPIYITRSITKAKQWVIQKSRGLERYGVLASSGAKRLRADGIALEGMSIEKWLLKGKEDVNSSYFLEIAATEFDIQGLEIDYSIVAWEGDYRYNGESFVYYNFLGSKWRKVNKEANQRYLKNTYRVLLTRARQGMVLYIPQGNPEDITRLPEIYNNTYKYLKDIGLQDIDTYH